MSPFGPIAWRLQPALAPSPPMELPSSLPELSTLAAGCTMCRLAETRTSVVFGVGAEDADLMLIGEAPGRNEDLQGEPFVGAAGRLLDTLLAETGLARSDVYIANVLKCRPPGNRDPLSDEIESCKGYLHRQLELVSPRVVITLGNFATRLLLRTEAGITRLRGRSYPWWRGMTVVPTFHPAAALRGGDQVVAGMRADFAVAVDALAGSVVEEMPTEPFQPGLFG